MSVSSVPVFIESLIHNVVLYCFVHECLVCVCVFVCVCGWALLCRLKHFVLHCVCMENP